MENSMNDIVIEQKAKPELLVLADVLKIAVPGLKMPHVTMAATIERMLNKRGVALYVRDAEQPTP